DVSEHVVQPEGVWLERPNGVRLVERVIPVPRHFVERLLVRSRVIGASCHARILPLGRRGKAVVLSRLMRNPVCVLDGCADAHADRSVSGMTETSIRRAVRL